VTGYKRRKVIGIDGQEQYHIVDNKGDSAKNPAIQQSQMMMHGQTIQTSSKQDSKSTHSASLQSAGNFVFAQPSVTSSGAKRRGQKKSITKKSV
jgi:hypothetical protein